MKKGIRLLAMIIAAALCFSACGSTSTAVNSPAKEETVTAPQKEETAAPEPVKEETAEPEDNEPEAEVEPEDNEPEAVLIDGMRPEIKDAIDSYEEFINTYCEFLENYDSTNAMMLMKYAEMMNSYSELSVKFEAMEDEDLNDEELKYYTAVSLRCSSKILEASANLTSDMSGLMSGLSDLAGSAP